MVDHSASGKGRDVPALVVGVLLFVIAAVLWWDAGNLQRAVAYGIGPTMMPKVVAVGLVVLGLLSVLSGLRGGGDGAPAPVDWRAIGLIIGGFLGLTTIIGLGGGFIPAMTVLFVATSTAFGRRAFVADTALALALALATYLMFNKLLALNLPRGPIENLIG